ncbi:glycosyltransferase family 4 protein [Ruegeria atlantica]|uniref:glycosyltransferase family 4 protein n=1 Tax=Ruegeria atlantica TaxID=81569 RepID=UPI002493D744|nr:glycosyltransferase family 4 protein [Ruegeria atlantica]
MRIVQIINSFGYQSGGAERLVQDLHLDLLAAGVDAHLVALEQCETAGLCNAVSLGFSSPYKPGVIPALRKYLSAMTPKPDVMHAHLFPTSAWVAGLRKIGGIRCPVIFTEHSTSNNRRGSAVGKIVDPLIYDQFEKIFCISDGTLESLVAAYPTLSGKAEILLNGASLRFDNFTKRNTADRVKIVSVGSLRKAKNYSAALEALELLPENKCEYRIVGDGDLRADLEARAAAMKTLVRFEGHVTDVSSFLQEADIFLMTSLWEGFGLAAVEGMNAGLPVVASDIAGLRDVVGTDGTCALLVPPTEPRVIAKALETLIEDAQKRQIMGEAGFRRAESFDKRLMSEKYIAAYHAAARVVSYA